MTDTPPILRLAVTGGRNHTPTPAEMRAFEYHWKDHTIITKSTVLQPVLYHGGCQTGVDYLVSWWCAMHDRIVIPFPAEWDKYGYGAGPRRNHEMMEAADILVAFPGGRGTKNCIEAAEKLGKPVFKV